jgi:hypothetical protein
MVEPSDDDEDPESVGEREQSANVVTNTASALMEASESATRKRPTTPSRLNEIDARYLRNGQLRSTKHSCELG